MRTISDIIKEAGGARAIEAASDGRIKSDAVYKWATNGIPDRHWPTIMALTPVTTDELFAANRTAREGAVA